MRCNCATIDVINTSQAITVAIDQYAEKALGNRDYLLNKLYSVG